ncbi:MAG: cell division protein FtsZ [Thermoleophilia bacterium]|nr:cell division protein FtsZ [Thermoleophilia bacterium]
MREGPLADLFRSTTGEGGAQGLQSEAPTDSRASDIPQRIEGYAVVRVVGVGGGGCNAVDRMVEAGLRGVEFVAINTDRQALDSSRADVVIPVGAEVTRGLGTGGDPAIGEMAFRESEEHLRRVLRGSDLVFIAAGEGGGTGTGGAPIVAKVVRELGALAVAMVTRPFGFEGSKRANVAELGIQHLSDAADTVIVIPNDRLMTVLERGTSVGQAFAVADDLLRQGVQGISDLITLPGLINVDFADVRTILKGAGTALLGIGYASGGSRATDAATAAISSALLETPVDGARGILLGITGGPNLSLVEVTEAAQVVADAADPDANIIFGATIDEDLDDQVWVTVVAAGLSGTPTRATGTSTSSRPSATRIERGRRERPASNMAAAPEISDPPEAPDLSAGVPPPVRPRGESAPESADPAPRQITEVPPSPADESSPNLFSTGDNAPSSGSGDPDVGPPTT